MGLNPWHRQTALCTTELHTAQLAGHRVCNTTQHNTTQWQIPNYVLNPLYEHIGQKANSWPLHVRTFANCSISVIPTAAFTGVEWNWIDTFSIDITVTSSLHTFINIYTMIIIILIPIFQAVWLLKITSAVEAITSVSRNAFTGIVAYVIATLSIRAAVIHVSVTLINVCRCKIDKL